MSMKKRRVFLAFLVVLVMSTVSLWSTSTGRRLIKIVNHSRLMYLKMTLKEEGKPLSLNDGEIRIIGSLYLYPQPDRYPGIVLLHGSTPAGRKLPLYMLLAKTLAYRHYAVLSIDLRGFGESDDPKLIDRADSWDVSRDVYRAVSYLRSLPFVDSSKIYLIGHSMGGSYAVAASMDHQRISKVVAIGPGRRVYSRILSPVAPHQQYFHERFSLDRKLQHMLPIGVFLQVADSWKLENYLDYFSGNHHPPILLIDGALESKGDLSYLSDFSERISQPKLYVTIPNSDHYSNTMGIGPFIVYDARAFGQLVDVIDRWLKHPIDIQISD
jgi:pimeloyl-ACP methyl ester carboxylesterase